MDRVILHSDMNNFFASVECLSRPEIRSKPVIVCGKTENRHGIVLAKNNVAKRLGVSTGEPVQRAEQKCGSIVMVDPDFGKYLMYSNLAKEIYSEYTDRVESFGIDECWLDISGGLQGGAAAANDIRRRIKKETGLTVSIGVSFTKTFAKLCSDLRKPDAVTAVGRADFREKIWPLPCRSLIGVGEATGKRLDGLCIRTIGELAKSQPYFLKSRLGKNGMQLWAAANGYDVSPVLYAGQSVPMKSISNGITGSKDLYCDSEVRAVIYSLSESVSARLRRQGAVCRTVSVDFRFSDLSHMQRQTPLDDYTDITSVIAEKAYEIYRRWFTEPRAVRSITVKITDFIPASEVYYQTDLFGIEQQTRRSERLDRAVDSLRNKFGYNSIVRGSLLSTE